LHLAVKANFEKNNKEKLEQVYLSFKKKNEKLALSVNVYSQEYEKESGQYRISVDIQN